jgi:UDP-N-acetyl-2-amino-2-deoxyglucuronate dehydrogenase
VPIRVGIVGCGAIYPTHAKAIGRIANATLSGFFDILPERSLAAQDVFGAPSCSTLEELCGESDAVTICVPSGLHAEVGRRVAELGVHVLVEKPIDVTLEAATSLVKACREANVKLGVVSQHRFARDILRLKDTIDASELGPMIQGDAYIKWYRTQHYYDSGEWRGTWKLDGGGCLINQGIHYIDMIQWLMGGVASVQAQVRTSAHSIEVEDVAAALVEYKSGALGVIQGSTSFFPGFAERLEVHGRHGSVIIEGDRSIVWEVDPEGADDSSPYGRGVTQQPTPNVRIGEKLVELTKEEHADRWIEQHRLQIQDFVDSVEQDRDPFVTGEMALEPLRVILAIYQSAQNGGARVTI